MLYLEARNRCESVEIMMMSRIQRFFMTFVCSEDFLEMDFKDLLNWLQVESIRVNIEVEVFYSAARWLLHDWEHRKKYLSPVMELVRFGLLEPWRIVDFRKNENQGKLSILLDDEEVQKMLESSLSYAVYRLSCDDSSERFSDFLSRFNFKRLHPRNVMVDNVWQRNFKHTSYSFDQFEEYLKIIRSNVKTDF
jgi:hypothetical protein